MSQIYVSGPWSYASGVLQGVKSIKIKSRADKVIYMATEIRKYF